MWRIERGFWRKYWRRERAVQTHQKTSQRLAPNARVNKRPPPGMLSTVIVTRGEKYDIYLGS
jgi:hypothetical protein